MPITFHQLTKSFAFLFILLIPSILFGAVTLPTFFGDNMVLQQKTGAVIWGWAKAGSNIQVIPSWDRRKYSAKAGEDGKWKLSINTPAAGGPYEITITDGSPVILHNVLIGEVWVCSGQSNMEMPMKGFKDQALRGSNDAIFNSANDLLRLYIVPRSVKIHPQDTSKRSSWKIATSESVSNFSATAYYFGRLLQQQLKVPVGLINISYSGSPAEAFMSEEALKEFPEIKIPAAADSAKANNKVATTLYNGMLHPFAGYTIKGCIWYQGETNYDRPDQYEKLFPAMVKEWRTEFGEGDFPFYFAQIAPYNYAQLPNAGQGGKFNSAYLRDAQRKSAETIPNSGMIVLLDIGEENSIHPADKETGGKRFAYMALAKTYGYKGFGYCSPAYDSMIIKGNVVTIKFKDADNGLTTFGKPLTNFEIAGPDKVFHSAKAVISRGTVLVSSPEVTNPVAVRYAFRDFVAGELFSTEGFPVSSFRTDNW